jgi:hypothetical protein
MFTLIVNGIPAVKLGSKRDIPEHHGEESWLVVDERGKMIAYYLPS